jgi:hypothetical protein
MPIFARSFIVLPQDRKNSLPDVLEDVEDEDEESSVVYGTIYIKSSS